MMRVVGVTEDNKQGVCDAVASGLSGECSYVSLEGPSTSRRRKLEASQVYMDIAVANAQSATALAQDETFTTSLAMPDGTNAVGVTVSGSEEGNKRFREKYKTKCIEIVPNQSKSSKLNEIKIIRNRSKLTK